ncbi:MAG: PqqD family peptide modification chaperone, partial [Limisphaerales bacterium]
AEPRRVSDVLAARLAEYDGPADRSRADLFALLEKLRAAGLIVVQHAAPA